MIYVLGGTKESREIIDRLLQTDQEVVASVVSEYGKRLLTELGEMEIITEKLDQTGMKEIIKKYEVEVVIDATHPFARKVSENIIEVAGELDIKNIRFERARIDFPESELIIKKPNFQSVIDYIDKNFNKVLLTIGSKELAKFEKGITDFQERVIVRVLPVTNVIKECQKELSIPPSNIIALQGPFSYELNKQILIDYNIDLLVTKASGKKGGLDTKLKAAHKLDIPVLVIERPKLNYSKVFSNYKKLMDYLVQLSNIS